MFKVTEIYGPVFQGEGPLAGTQTFFVRMFGCDSACVWCDSRYSWHPEFRGAVRTVTAPDIIKALGDGEQSVTFSGGNPMLWDLRAVVLALDDKGRRTAIETQGTAYKSWAALCDVVVISPKGPSSGEVYRAEDLAKFTGALSDDCEALDPGVGRGIMEATTFLKFPISGKEDLEWAADLWKEHKRLTGLDLSVWAMPVSPPDPVPGDVRIATATRELENMVVEAGLPCAVSPQLHVLTHGGARGR